MYKPVKDLSDILHLHEMNGKELQELRMSLGLTQNDIAHAMDCTVQTVKNIERDAGGTKASYIFYALILERYFAYRQGLIPGYRTDLTPYARDIEDIRNQMKAAAKEGAMRA